MCIVATQRLSKHVPATTNTRNNRIVNGRVVFHTVLFYQWKVRDQFFPEFLVICLENLSFTGKGVLHIKTVFLFFFRAFIQNTFFFSASSSSFRSQASYLVP
jgi:hypothetical protein